MGTGVAWIDGPALWVAAIAALCGGLFTIAKFGKALVRVLRRLDRVATQLLGDDETPSLDARLSSIEHELHPNGGSSMRDAVNRTEKALGEHIEQSKARIAAGQTTETELRKAISDIASALPTIAESTPPAHPSPATT